MKNIGGNSRFIGFIDECGDHSMEKIDPDFPIFLLCMAIVERQKYAEEFIPAIAGIKLRYWNHEGINLHSRDIRKANGPFAFLMIPEKRVAFLAEISDLMKKMAGTIFITCINKKKHIERYRHNANNPYEVALLMSMERVVHFLEQNDAIELPIIAESRGKQEDAELEKAFYEILASGTSFIPPERFKAIQCPLVFWDKRANIAGLQMADLAAYPCARHILKPDQPNQAFDIIQGKIYQCGSVRGWKIFP